jgi:hypothetical protein
MAATAFSPQPSPARSASPSYLWEVPGKPVIVRVALEVVDRLEREVAESFRSLEVQGSEIGGLLLGAVQGSRPFEVSILSYDVVPSEYKRGPLYQLSPRDLERFEDVLEQRVGASMQIVGFFRSHTREGLGLDTEDIAIFNRFFPKRYQVALLAKPFAMRPTTGAIFIREGCCLRRKSSYKEFPFRTDTVEGRGASVASLKGGGRATPAPAFKPGAGQPSAVGRATVIRPESRGGVIVAPLQAPKVGSETARRAAFEIAAETITAPAQAATALTAPPELQPAASPDRQTTPQRTAENTGSAVKFATPGESQEEANSCEALDELLTGPAPAAALPGDEALQKRRSFGLMWIAVSATLIGIVRVVKPICIAPSAKLVATLKAARPICIAASAKLATAATDVRPMWIAGASAAALVVLSGLLLFPGLHLRKRPATTSSRNTSTLSFRVERSAGELLITWNRDADVIHEATHAVLAIADGEWQQSVDLDQAQLRHGGIVYLPSNSDINFQLTVTGRKASQTQSQSVRVLRVSPWATPERLPASPPKPVPKSTRAANTPALMSFKASEVPDAELTKAPNEAAPQADELAQSSALATALDLPDAPGLTPGPQAQAVLIPGNMAAPAETQVSLFQLLPTAPPDIPEPGVGGRASEAHHVKSAKALSGPPVLHNPAVAAVGRWVYKPLFRLPPIHRLSRGGPADETKAERAHIWRPQHGPMAVTDGESQRQ